MLVKVLTRLLRYCNATIDDYPNNGLISNIPSAKLYTNLYIFAVLPW
jgi:hypothetical protein